MQAINHQLTTGSLYVVCMYQLPELFPWMDWPGLIVALIAALLPDVDHHKSRVGRLVPFISIPLHALLGHRGALHSLLAAVGLYYLAQSLSLPYINALVFGYLLHLVGDMATKAGVNLFWPFGQRYHLPLKVARNGLVEWLTTASCVLLMGWTVWTN